MGAKIKIEGRVATVYGTDRLKGNLVTAPDLRGGAALVIAGLAAEGTTRVRGLEHIDRGYENIEGMLASAGASIQRV